MQGFIRGCQKNFIKEAKVMRFTVERCVSERARTEAQLRNYEPSVAT